MEKKIINLNVYEAKNIICVWNEKYPKADSQYGVALDDAEVGYIVPSHYVVATFSDGSVKAAGLLDLNQINRKENLFLYSEFLDYVGKYTAKAFVRHELSCSSEEESIIKIDILHDLQKAGVEISDEAEEYLRSF